MRKKIEILIVVLILVMPIYIVKTSIVDSTSPGSSVVNISIAVHNSSFVVTNLLSAEHLTEELDDYNWTVGNTSYIFHTSETYMDDLGYNRLNQYDVLIIAGISPEEIFCAFPNFRLPGKDYFFRDIKTNLENFISNGGGYIGHCGGAFFAVEKDLSYHTFSEKIENDNTFLNTPLKSHITVGFPIASEYMYYDDSGRPHLCLFPWNDDPDPTRIGSFAYIGYSGWDYSNSSHYFGGVPFHMQISDNTNPILKGYLSDSWFGRWNGGPSFTLPQVGVQNLSCLALYPSDAFQLNTSTDINAWSFNRPSFDIVHYILELIHAGISGDPEPFLDFYGGDSVNFHDWDQTSQKITLDYANRPAVVSFSYGNGRVFLSAIHSEAGIWNDGHIVDKYDESHNTLKKGLYRVSVSLRDSEGSVLLSNLDDLLAASYPFIVEL